MYLGVAHTPVYDMVLKIEVCTIHNYVCLVCVFEVTIVIKV